jgi:hypothetical protein
MKTLSETEIIHKISKRELFSATITGGGFSLKIDSYQPAVSTAIHNGGNIRQELAASCLLSQPERYYEEDPHTGSFIEQQPLTLICHDSRYEYDLNRSHENCVYETAWGRKVWEPPLGQKTIMTSREKHACFYRIVKALITALVADFGQCIVYDIHSYNFRRYDRTDLPVFNLGTSTVTNTRWRPLLDTWLSALANIRVNGLEISAAENDIFFGKGYLAEYCHTRFDTVLVLATEVKKVFMDELSGEADTVILPAMRQQFNAALSAHTAMYLKQINRN